MPTSMASILGWGIVIVVALLAWNRLMVPKAGTTLLASTVWAALGPYNDAEEAEKALRSTSKVVFSRDSGSEHEVWIQGHVKNFRDWERAGNFAKSLKTMRVGLLLFAHGRTFQETLKAVREEMIAQVVQGMDWVNKEYLERWGHKLEAVRGADGSFQLTSRQVLSDEEITQRKQQMALNVAGILWTDESTEGKALLEFLSAVHQFGFDSPPKNTTDIANVYLTMLDLRENEKEPQLVNRFQELNTAWIAQLPENEANT